jgi:SmpA / OmlA family
VSIAFDGLLTMKYPQLSGSWLAAIGTVLLLLSSQAVPAQPPPQPADDIAALRKQVNDLQRILEDMQKRLDAMEACRASQPASNVPSSGAAAEPSPAEPEVRSGDSGAATASGTVLTPQVAENWSALRKGMNPEQVKALLGAPGRDFKLGGQTVWYYYYTGVGGGSVAFSRGDGNLLDWQRPPFHGWW